LSLSILEKRHENFAFAFPQGVLGGFRPFAISVLRPFLRTYLLDTIQLRGVDPVFAICLPLGAYSPCSDEFRQIRFRDAGRFCSLAERETHRGVQSFVGDIFENTQIYQINGDDSKIKSFIRTTQTNAQGELLTTILREAVYDLVFGGESYDTRSRFEARSRELVNTK